MLSQDLHSQLGAREKPLNTVHEVVERSFICEFDSSGLFTRQCNCRHFARGRHHFKVVMHGCQIQVFYGNAPVFDVCDQTLARGRIGLWPKSDAVTYFDDLDLTVQK